MQIEILKSKIHRVTVTEANIDYVGSVTIDEDLMDAARLVEFEKVTVVDMDRSRAEALKKAHDNFRVKYDLMDAVMESGLIFNASPARVPGEWIREGAIISSPGMPFSFDDEGLRRVGTLIHDPLQIGVSVMAVWSAGKSLSQISIPEGREIKMEAI
mgnify:CR=1 FL=1